MMLGRNLCRTFSLRKELNSTAIVPKRRFNSNGNAKASFKANSLPNDSKFSWKAGALFGTALAAIPWIGKEEDEGPLVPGSKEKLKTKIGETIAEVVQTHHPVNEFYTHLTGVLCEARNPEKQIPVHLYVSHINEDFMQALIMDGESKDARLIGIEYIITPKLFEDLPLDERKLWHSLNYLVRSGVLVAPRLPTPLENKLMKNLSPTYGKAFYLWDRDQALLPVGVPQMLSAPVHDGVLKTSLLKKIFDKYGYDWEKIRSSRSEIPEEFPLQGIDLVSPRIVLEAKIVGPQ